jgi:hypothetical protein
MQSVATDIDKLTGSRIIAKVPPGFEVLVSRPNKHSEDEGNEKP